MKRLSLEYAHIYTNQQFGDEQKLSIDLLGQVIEKENRNDLVLTIMIDDYSFPDPSFDYNNLISHLSNFGFAPDFLIRESVLIKDCDQVIKIITDLTLRESITQYIIEKKKYPCSLFIATWYLIRLGYIKTELFPDDFIAEKLINILPESFISFEEKGFEIIKNTPYAHALDQIENKYFKGRII